MIRIRKGLRDIPFSHLRAIVEKTQEIEKKENVKIIRLTVGAPDFDVPLNIKLAVKRCLENNKEKEYVPSNYGFLELRKLIAKKVKEKNNIDVNAQKNILVTVGSGEGIALAMFTILNPGDEVLIADPSWPYYEQIARIVGAKPVFYPLRDEYNFIPNVDEIEALINKKTKMIIVNTPHNPTGVVFSRKVLEKIAFIAKKHDLAVLSDEAYEDIIYDDARHCSIASLPEMFERTITTFSFSKSYAMLPWRVGYVVAPSHIIQAFVKLHQYTVISVDTLSQYGAISALKEADSKKAIEYMVGEYDKRRKLVMDILNNCKYLSFCIPKGTFYIFPRIDPMIGMDDFEFVNYLIKEARIAVAPGMAFGPTQGKSHIRISYAVKFEDLKKGLQQMQRALERI